MVTPQFKEAYKKLNAEQRQAVDMVEGPVMVVAGPGTGKTQILTLRIANILLKTDANPSNILALTFTESAVLAMRKRLVDMIGPDGYKVYITTFHSFCNDIIQENAEDFPHLLSAESITELEQIQILEEVLKELDLELLRPFGDPLYHIKNLLSAINELKREGISVNSFRKGIADQEKSFKEINDLFYESGVHRGKMKGKYQNLEKDIRKNQELVLVYEKYQMKLREYRYYDYSDMIMEVLGVLEKNENLLLRLQERYQYILVDEHQDTNSAQNRIIELLGNFFEGNPNLFVVGDEKQAIYRFQGASLENFLYFKKLYPEAVLINLTQNYRSSQFVLDASGSVIARNVIPESSFIKREVLKAARGLDNKKIKVMVFDDFFEEYRFLAKDIKEKLDKGVLPSEIAIIFRNNKDVFPIVESFEQYGVPFIIESDQDILADIDVLKFVSILRAVEHFGDDVYLIPLLHLSFFNIYPLDAFKIIKLSQKSGYSIYELLEKEDALLPLELKNKESVMNLYRNLAFWCQLSKNDCIENVYIEVLRESGLLSQIMKRADVLEKLDKFSGLYSEIKVQVEKRDNFNLAGLLNYLDLLKVHKILIKKPSRNSIIRAVRLMTAHKSKGLEFEYVYITQAYDGHWGNKKLRQFFKLPWSFLGVMVNEKNNIDELESDLNTDERRLFYVAMTRAKREILITYSRISLEGREQLPSQFVEEIDPQFKEIENCFSEDEENKESSEGVLVKVNVESNLLDRNLFTPRLILGVGIKDKEFYQFLFESEGLSVTALNNYLKCPWRYFYTNLIRIPFHKEKQQIFGTAIHLAIGGYLARGRESRMQSKGDIGKEIMLKLFEEALSHEPLSSKERDELLGRGKVYLSGYYDNFSSEWNKDFLMEFNVKGVVLKDKIKIAGRIDKLEKISNSKNVVITDIKTGKPKTRGVIEGSAKSSYGAGDYKRQINFYKLLLDNYEKDQMVAEEGVVEFVQPDDKGRFHQERFLFNKDELKEVEEQIILTADEIWNLGFWNKRCGDRDCEYCKLRDMLE